MNEVVAARKGIDVGNEDDHDLLLVIGSPNENMPDHPPPLILDIGRDFEALEQALNHRKDMHAPLILDEALGDRNDHMGILFIESAIGIPAVIQSKRHLDFVPIIIRIIHPKRRENTHFKMPDFTELLLK
jgi:hypothetical protein